MEENEMLNRFKVLFPDLEVREGNLYINDGKNKIPLLEINGEKQTLYFLYYDQEKNEYTSQNDLKYIEADKKFNLGKIIRINRYKYGLSHKRNIKKILDLDSQIDGICLSQSSKKPILDTLNKKIEVPVKKYLEIHSDAERIFKRTKRYFGSVERFLVNQMTEKHSKRKFKKITSIEPGEFEFLVHRLNLSSKKKNADFKKFLNDSDIISIQELVAGLVRENVFDAEFMRKLNDFFIKERLEEIIQTGREILSLNSTDLQTVKANKIIKKITDDKRSVKQLESVWQKYFERYLLFLIFSYKGIYPKIKLTNIEETKKFPDFIGINHYNGIDVIEIKTHLKNALIYDKSHDNFAFSSELSKAIIQTTNYMDAIIHENFKNPADKNRITNSVHEENLNRPRGIIIISSLNKLVKKFPKSSKEKIIRDFTKLRNCLNNIEILTFDEIIDIADNYTKNIIKEDPII